MSAAWDGTASGLNPTLAGYRELTFDATGGTTTGTIPGHYVYSNGSSYATPTVFDTSTWGTGFTVTLPDATRADYTFVGWCETSSCDGYLPRSVTTQGTSASPRPAGTSYDLAANRTLYAIWSLNPPTITSAAAWAASPPERRSPSPSPRPELKSSAPSPVVQPCLPGSASTAAPSPEPRPQPATTASPSTPPTPPAPTARRSP